MQRFGIEILIIRSYLFLTRIILIIESREQSCFAIILYLITRNKCDVFTGKLRHIKSVDSIIVA